MTKDLPPAPDDWYHCIDLPGGRTPGFFDLTRSVADLPWPEVAGKRCLDIATYDGFWAFELERRGAKEVVALDLTDKAEIDYVPRRRGKSMHGPTGAGFLHAAAALESSVQRVLGSVYTLDPEEIGTFDIVLMGSLLAHLRAPMSALERARRVCSGTFITMEPVDLMTSVVARKKPILALIPGFDWVWTTPNIAGHRTMVEMAGFDIVEQRTSVLDYTAPVAAEQHVGRARTAARRAGMRSLGLPVVDGLPQSLIVARPAPGLSEEPTIATRPFG